MIYPRTKLLLTGGIILCLLSLEGPFYLKMKPAWGGEGNQSVCLFDPVNQSPQQDSQTHDLERAAQQIYRQSYKLYSEGAYWNCAGELIILLDYYPQFSKVDGVVFLLAQCLSEMEINTPAIRMYKYLLTKYPQSEFVPWALFGLQKINYRLGNYKESLDIYYSILKNYSAHPAVNGARYYAGQSYYNLKDYDMVLNILRRIDERNEFYDYALYTSALSLLKKKRIRMAVDYFRQLTSLPVISSERRKIIDDARLTLGFIYFELGYYKEAIRYFDDISDAHENYSDALLGIGWSFLKLAEYQQALLPLQKLVKRFPGTENAEEAYFVLGQCYMKLKVYDEAIASYRTIVELFPANINLKYLQEVKTELTQEEERLEKLKIGLLVQESKLLDTLPLDGYGKEVPQYVEKERKKIEEFRNKLIEKLVKERDYLTEVQFRIDELKNLAARKQRRKDWRGYAEYGISRALFLKEMQ